MDGAPSGRLNELDPATLIPAVSNFLSAAEFTNALLVAGSTLIAATICVKSFKHGQIVILGVGIDTTYAWVPFTALTLAHLYCGMLIAQATAHLLAAGPAYSRSAWSHLVDGNLIFFHGLAARLGFVIETLPGGHRTCIFEMKGPIQDPTTILVHVTAVGLFFAVASIRRGSWRTRVGTVLAAAILVVSNWLIGGGWAVHASLLKATPEQLSALRSACHIRLH